MKKGHFPGTVMTFFVYEKDMRDAVQTRAIAPQFTQVEKVPSLSRGAEILVRGLIKNGVDTVFGLPGGAVLHIYDAIWRFRD
ncbi:MAG TPA: thiamine pyrophosphate-binding protein, partial [Pyrinomonadaceae bacterium]|nr:thiamine pyrophosphate-binding protein [Pyrinomonadaceae bacterium]